MKILYNPKGEKKASQRPVQYMESKAAWPWAMSFPVRIHSLGLASGHPTDQLFLTVTPFYLKCPEKSELWKADYQQRGSGHSTNFMSPCFPSSLPEAGKAATHPNPQFSVAEVTLIQPCTQILKVKINFCLYGVSWV